MPIEYRHLTKNELDTFIEMRIEQLSEEGAAEDIDLRSMLKDYYLRHLADGIFISWLAFDGEKLWEQAECPSWKSRRTSPAQAEESPCFQVCSQILVTGEKESQRNF